MTRLLPYVLAGAVGSAAIGLVSYRSYAGQRAVLTASIGDELRGVAAVKASQVAAWRAERLGDVRVLAASVQFMPDARDMLAGPAPAPAPAGVTAWMETVRGNYRYDSFALVDPAGQVRVAVGEPLGTARHHEALTAEALAAGQPVFRDFPRGDDVRTPHVALAAAVTAGGATLGAVILTIDPRATFFPVTLRWPRTTDTAEVLLVRRDGADVLYLTDPRNAPVPARGLREPLTSPTSPVVRAVRGEHVPAPGLDANGVPVLSASAPIPESAWVAVARIDQAEALRPLGGYATALTAVGAGLVATLGLALAWLRRYQVSQVYRQQYEAEAERRRLEDAHAQDRRRFEEQLRESQKLESVGRLAGGVAHDFNNLLTVINGYSDLLASRLQRQADLHDLAVQVLKAGERAAALTQQLLAFSRKQVIQPRVLSLNALVADTELMLSRLVGDAIELVIENSASPDRVVADPGQLHQVIVNLAVNARDAMPDGGRLTLETLTLPTLALDGAPAGGDRDGAAAYTVVLRVSDTGLGMDEAVQARIFEPFFTTKAAGRGTGLGLSTVYGIVKQSDGVVRVTSAPGSGTSIEVHLPGTDAPLAPDSTPARRLLHRGTETLLVVDDRHDVRRFVSRSLRGYGYRVLEAASGQEAIDAADAHPEPIDLLLTDVVMPGLNGRQLTERLREQRPDLTVLYMSGYSDNVLGEHGVLDPGVSYIQKPFTPDDLAVKIRATLRRFDGPQRLLVVDGEPAIRALLQQLLAPSGCDVLLAADRVEALEIVTGIDRLDVIVIDLAALEPNGTQMIETLRTYMPAIKVVVMSGAFGADWGAGTGPAGVDAILAKPIDPAHLFNALQDLVTRSAT